MQDSLLETQTRREAAQRVVDNLLRESGTYSL